MGLSAVTYDSEAPAIYLKGTRMNQHLGHSCKLLRSADRTDGVDHQLGNYLYTFAQTLNAVETFNYSYCPGDQTQRADWQAFSASAAAQAIIQGKIGLVCHQGGIHFVPANDNTVCRISNLHLKQRKYSADITGGGSFAEITLNGEKLSGSMQLPSDMLKSDNHLDIKRTSNNPGCITLMWALDTEISDVKSDKDSLQFRINNTVFSKMEFYAPSDAEITVNGREVNADYDAVTHRLWFSGILRKNDIVKIS